MGIEGLNPIGDDMKIAVEVDVPGAEVCTNCPYTMKMRTEYICLLFRETDLVTHVFTNGETAGSKLSECIEAQIDGEMTQKQKKGKMIPG